MSGLFGGGNEPQPPPPPPAPKPTPPMPDLESPMVLEAGERRKAAILARGGRRSTILSGDSADQPYTRATLGG
jgi:hypothetical protein